MGTRLGLGEAYTRAGQSPSLYCILLRAEGSAFAVSASDLPLPGHGLTPNTLLRWPSSFCLLSPS